MRVLFVQKEGGIFGAENYHLKAIPGLLDKGVNVEFLRLYTDYQGGINGPFIERLKEMGVTTHQVDIGRYPTPTRLIKIKRIVLKGSFDLVHTHLIHADFYLALIKAFLGLGVPIVSTKHGYDNTFTSKYGFEVSKQSRTPYFLVSKWAESRMNASYTISKGLLDFFVATGLSKSKKMKLIHYGFDMKDHFLQNGHEKYRLAEKQLIIAGRLIAFKGHKFLIEAMLELRAKYGEHVKLVIAGTGQLERELKDLVDQLGLSLNVEFLGYSERVGSYMANSDVVVIPSISEGFGVVFLEAFAAKTPVVAWDVPAGKELLRHEQTGYLVQPYEVSHLSAQLIDILESPSNQERIVEGAYAQLKEYFNLSRMIEETIHFYRTVLQE